MKNLIERCQARHEKPLSALQTRVSSTGYSVYYASRDGKLQSTDPHQFAEAGLGILPIARTGFSIEKYSTGSGKDWETRYGVEDWQPQSWKRSYGVQVYTGLPSDYLTDLDFEYVIVKDYPELLIETLSRLCDLTSHPLMTISKSGGVRWTCRTPDYMHPKRNADREYIGVWDKNGDRSALYLEIFSEKGLSRWDARYEIVEGDLFNIPVIDTESLFAVIDDLKDRIHVPPPAKEKSKPQKTLPTSKKKPKTEEIEEIYGLPSDLKWIKSGNGDYKSQRGDYPCKVTKHIKSQGSAQYYLKPTGEIQAFCHNCSKTWIARSIDQKELIAKVRVGEASPLALSRKPSKLEKHDRAYALLDTVAKASEQIAKFLKSASRIFAFRAETGAGKNYQTEAYALNIGAILQTTPTTVLAEDLEKRMKSRFSEAGHRESDVFRWRGLTQKADDPKAVFPHEKPCVQGKRADIFRSKGSNIYKTICPYCPAEVECRESGYLSQIRNALAARAVILPISDVFTNPTYRNFTDEFFAQEMTEQLCIVDEVDIFDLFVECQLTKERLNKWSTMWEKWELGVFARKLLTLLEVENTPFAIGEYIASLSDGDQERIAYQMQHVRLAVNTGDNVEYQVHTLDDAIARALLPATTEQELKELPSVDGEWTTLDKLTMFFDRYKRFEDSPMTYRDSVLRWVVFPEIHRKVNKIGFMSATLNLDLFKRVFPEAETLEIPLSQWVPGARCFQLRTAKNPRATVIKRDSEGKFEDLNDTGTKIWQMMIAEIQKTPHLNHGIITYKDVLEWAHVDLKELTITATANFGGLVGLDTDFQNVDVLWVVFAPEIPPYETEWRAKILFGNDDITLDMSRDPITGVFVDERMQQIYDAGVQAELIQAVGRARLNRLPHTVVILSAHYLPGITDRPQTYLFDETDFEVAEGLEQLTEVVQAREKAENDRDNNPPHNKSIADFQVSHGVTRQWANVLWKRAGGEEQKIKLILKLRENGLSLRQIAKKVGISKDSVNNILKRYAENSVTVKSEGKLSNIESGHS